MRVPTVVDLFSQFKAQGYELKDSASKPFDLNIVGWRNSEGLPNEFSDYIAVYYIVENHKWVARYWKATTRPGAPYLRNPLNPKGTAILKPGQYRSAYALGIFKGYTALKQMGSVDVWRDDDRDDIAEPLKDDKGFFGIHVHKAGLLTKLVGLASAGCQVFQRSKDFDEFIAICKEAARRYGNSFTYTLLEF